MLGISGWWPLFLTKDTSLTRAKGVPRASVSPPGDVGQVAQHKASVCCWSMGPGSAAACASCPRPGLSYSGTELHPALQDLRPHNSWQQQCRNPTAMGVLSLQFTLTDLLFKEKRCAPSSFRRRKEGRQHEGTAHHCFHFAALCCSQVLALNRKSLLSIYISSVSLLLFSTAPGASGLYPVSAFCSWAVLSLKALCWSWQPCLQIC